MNLRSTLYDLAHQHSLTRSGLARLFQLGGWDDEPHELQHWFWRSVALIAAALGGFGIVLWIAANWQLIGSAGHFILLETLVVASCLGAWRWPAARLALGLLALFGIGALLAYFGQTYQTGSDAWQLFALWTVLAVPLCLALRSDVLWAPWVLVAMTAVTFWSHAYAPVGGQQYLTGWGITLTADAIALLLTALLSPTGPRLIGGGVWAYRSAGTLAVVMITLTAISALIASTMTVHYGLSLVVLTAGAVLLARRRHFDIYLLSVVTLALNTLLVSGLARALLKSHDNELSSLLLIGLAATVLLAASVSGLLRLTRINMAAAKDQASS